MILLPLLSVSMPANTGMVFDLLTRISAFDLVETNEFLTELLKLKPKDPLNAKFETIGFESPYLINNLGTFAIILAFNILRVLLWCTCCPLKGYSKRLRKLSEKLGSAIFWNSWIILINESFLTVGLCLMISLKHNYEYGS